MTGCSVFATDLSHTAHRNDRPKGWNLKGRGSLWKYSLIHSCYAVLEGAPVAVIRFYDISAANELERPSQTDVTE
jgi:hypothetical protein